ncbi:MAG: family 10 glycosylhydrolase [Bacteroidetes bacterium]|nr:family 10 glycosylhydrolase [Bacteroidota bacterium]
MKKVLVLFLLSLVLVGSVFAQLARETRAVWLTTNFRLDWPPKTTNQQIQQAELSNIINDIKKKKLNTLFFQVRSNGTTMFESSFEPYSPYLTGKTGKMPDYDPLEEAIKLSRKRGLEIHAWVNVMRCFAGEELFILENPKHLFNTHRNWLVERKDDGRKAYWLDPGLPEVRNYLVELFAEIVKVYDIDGLHLDFIRYPGKDFADDFSYNLYGDGQSRDDWRRNNINLFIEQLNYRIKEIKPYIKLGVTPIGIYENIQGARGLEGYSSVFQDTRKWLKTGLIDYAVPQIYWNFKDNPKFDVLARDWQLNSYGRNMILGIAAYKPEVKAEIENMIEYSRHIGAQGIAFFRYEHIKDYTFDSFDYYSYPAEMAWIDAVKPNPPFNLSYVIQDYDPFTLSLSWAQPKYNYNDAVTDYYALYSFPFDTAETDHKYLYDVVKATRDSLILSFGKPKRVNYHLALKSVDKLWNESEETSNIVDITIPELRRLIQNHSVFNKPALIRRNSGDVKLLLFANNNEEIEILGKNKNGLESILTRDISFGKNIFSLQKNISNFDTLMIVYKKSGREVELKL